MISHKSSQKGQTVIEFLLVSPMLLIAGSSIIAVLLAILSHFLILEHLRESSYCLSSRSSSSCEADFIQKVKFSIPFGAVSQVRFREQAGFYFLEAQFQGCWMKVFNFKRKYQFKRKIPSQDRFV